MGAIPGPNMVFGAISGGQKDRSKQEQHGGITMAPEGALEAQARTINGQSLGQLNDFVNAGPGMSDVTEGLGAQRSLADMFKAYSQQGGNLPTADDITRSNQLGQQMFSAQNLGMKQNFLDQTNQANNQAALMGRDANDPILRAKLAQEQTRQQAMLGAQQGSWATQNAMQQPGERLNMFQNFAGVKSGLATQAMANRQALLSMGSNVQNSERNFRMGSAERWGSQTQESGGGLKGAINGGLAGMATDFSMAKDMMSMAAGAPPSGGGNYAPTSGNSQAKFGGFGMSNQ